jgi:hypothetical protein
MAFPYKAFKMDGFKVDSVLEAKSMPIILGEIPSFLPMLL